MLPHNFGPRQCVDHLIGSSAVKLQVTFKDAEKIYGIYVITVSIYHASKSRGTLSMRYSTMASGPLSTWSPVGMAWVFMSGTTERAEV